MNQPLFATYIQKHLNLHTRIHTYHEQQMLSIIVDINNPPIEHINIYDLSSNEANSFLLLPDLQPNVFMSGVFYNHQAMWYAELMADTRIPNNIRRNKQHTNALVNYVELNAFKLQNTPGTFNYFRPANSKNELTILDLTFTRRHATTIAQAWLSDRGLGRTTDQSMTTTSLALGPPSFIARRIFGLMDWEKFEQTLQQLELPASTWKNATSTLAGAVAHNNHLQRVINTAVPWSKPSSTSKRWWTPEINGMKQKLGGP